MPIGVAGGAGVAAGETSDVARLALATGEATASLWSGAADRTTAATSTTLATTDTVRSDLNPGRTGYPPRGTIPAGETEALGMSHYNA